jgi:hypothetical protein
MIQEMSTILSKAGLLFVCARFEILTATVTNIKVLWKFDFRVTVHRRYYVR